MAGIPYLQEVRCAIRYLQETWGDPISAGNVDASDPISARNLVGLVDPISAGNLDGLGSRICMKPRWGDPVPTGSQMWNSISAGNLDGGGGGGDPISAGNLHGGIPYLQET